MHDPVRYVRRSVANHLGDIAKDHLELALDTAQRWLDVAEQQTGNDAADGIAGYTRWSTWITTPDQEGNERAISIRKALVGANLARMRCCSWHIELQSLSCRQHGNAAILTRCTSSYAKKHPVETAMVLKPTSKAMSRTRRSLCRSCSQAAAMRSSWTGAISVRPVCRLTNRANPDGSCGNAGQLC